MFVLVSYFVKNNDLVLKLLWHNLMVIPGLSLWLMLLNVEGRLRILALCCVFAAMKLDISLLIVLRNSALIARKRVTLSKNVVFACRIVRPRHCRLLFSVPPQWLLQSLALLQVASVIYCTPEMVQQMLISTLSAMGLQGNNSTNIWYVNSGASSHMTNNPTTLCHVRPYASQSTIQTANDSSLPIAAVGDASSKFTNVFLAPQLSTNLISVSQLVDNNCAVNFSGNSCVVQDQVMGELIAKGPKVRRLFLLLFPVPARSPISSIKSFACNNVSDRSMV
ncbi:uncharacterized protein LOC131164883 [Malania oleifera]|uniref:uncharacterized protein LOC131164883 n=1 Tax=Malania oleifera TaxID=397392 RepID=UPI0025ADBBD3|nr:uncharacterized protein LOC131164883 [Malania oleifera]